MSDPSGRPERLLTCCFCGGRSVLPAGAAARALVCHACGAPIRQIAELAPSPRRKAKGKTARKRDAVAHNAERPGAHLDKDRPSRRKKGKRRKGMGHRLWELFDDADDLFEDIFDFD